VNVGLDYGGIDAQAPTDNDFVLLGQSHHPSMDLLDDLRSKGLDHSPQSLGIGDLLGPDASELPIHQYALGIPANSVFQRRAEPRQKQLQRRYRRTQPPQRSFSSFRHRARSWSHQRRICYKAETHRRRHQPARCDH
jgi:hypothetical protein